MTYHPPHDTMPHWNPNAYFVYLTMDDGSVEEFSVDGENEADAEANARHDAIERGLRVADLHEIILERLGGFTNDRASELGI